MSDEIRRQPTAQQKVLEKEYLEGYQRTPESPLVGKLGERMAREVWQEETWD
ncbi:MAG: hypothetical protein ABSE79_23640 [Terriglobia bacterium]|jgi:hypothetical protein